MKDLVNGPLKISVSRAGEDVVVTWTGRSADRQPNRVLQPFFAELLDELDAEGGRIIMHFDELEHFNSSTISAVIQLVHKAKERGVGLVLAYDDKLRWQKISFDALRIFAKAPDTNLELRAV